MTANVGIAERADRLVAVLAATGLVGLGLPEILLTVVLCAAGRWPASSPWSSACSWCGARPSAAV